MLTHFIKDRLGLLYAGNASEDNNYKEKALENLYEIS